MIPSLDRKTGSDSDVSGAVLRYRTSTCCRCVHVVNIRMCCPLIGRDSHLELLAHLVLPLLSDGAVNQKQPTNTQGGLWPAEFLLYNVGRIHTVQYKIITQGWFSCRGDELWRYMTHQRRFYHRGESLNSSSWYVDDEMTSWAIDVSVFCFFQLLIPGRLLVLVAHDEVLLPQGQRRTQAGGRVVERLRLLGDVDQRRLEHLLHLHHCRGLQAAVPHLAHPCPDHCRWGSSAYMRTKTSQWISFAMWLRIFSVKIIKVWSPDHLYSWRE